MIELGGPGHPGESGLASAPEVHRCRPDQAAAWDAYVERAPNGSFCHRFGWLRVVERTFRHTIWPLLAERDGQVVGLLPLALVRSRLFGSMLVSTPVAVYGGVLADDEPARHALVDAALAAAHRLAVDYLELRNAGLEDHDPRLHALQRYVTFEHPLVDDEAALLSSLPGKVRNMIRKGRRQGLRSELGREALLDEFYHLFTLNQRQLGTPVQPKRLFLELLREFPADTDILIVRLGSRPIGTTLNLYFRDSVMPHYGAADPAALGTGVSNFMYWELMRCSAARGYRRFDFGRSKLGSGSWAFKHHWKMRERPLPYRYAPLRGSALPDLSPVNPRFSLAIATWKRLPLPLTRWLGPPLVRFIP